MLRFTYGEKKIYSSIKMPQNIWNMVVARKLPLIGDIAEAFSKFTKFPVTIVQRRWR